MKPTNNNCSLACQQRCEEKKKQAHETAASKQVPVNNIIVDGSKITLDDEPVQEEVIKQKDMDLSEVSHPDDVAERQLKGCTVIKPVQRTCSNIMRWVVGVGTSRYGSKKEGKHVLQHETTLSTKTHEAY